MARGIPKSVLEMLSAVPLFSACSKSELRAIAGLGTQISVAGGTVLTTQGEPGREFFLISSGEALCTVDGTEIARLGSGDFFGEMALVEGRPRNATVTAENQMEILVLSVPEFRSLLDSSPAIAEKIRTAVASRGRVSPAAQID